MKIIFGNILDCPKDEWIAHQANCTTYTSAGFAAVLMGKYPWCDCYARRKTKNLCDIPGNIRVDVDQAGKRHVIHIFGQWIPGKVRIEHRYPIYQKEEETNESRQKWFREALNKIQKLVPPPTKIAFPHGVGCGLAGGNWIEYEKMILDFEKESNIECIIYCKN